MANILIFLSVALGHLQLDASAQAQADAQSNTQEARATLPQTEKRPEVRFCTVLAGQTTTCSGGQCKAASNKQPPHTSENSQIDNTPHFVGRFQRRAAVETLHFVPKPLLTRLRQRRAAHQYTTQKCPKTQTSDRPASYSDNGTDSTQ